MSSFLTFLSFKTKFIVRLKIDKTISYRQSEFLRNVVYLCCANPWVNFYYSNFFCQSFSFLFFCLWSIFFEVFGSITSFACIPLFLFCFVADIVEMSLWKKNKYTQIKKYNLYQNTVNKNAKKKRKSEIKIFATFIFS